MIVYMNVYTYIRRLFLVRRPEPRVYLDYAAATPVWREVRDAMAPYLTEIFANPSAIHAEGQRAREAVDHARARLATLLTVRPEEITFTSGGTEANNLALFGTVEAALARGAYPGDIDIISTAVEHPSVLLALSALQRRGVTVHYARVDYEGLIDTAHLVSLLSPKTLLVTFAYVNSETGVVQDVRNTVRAITRVGETSTRPYVHIDASQAPLWLSCAMDSLGVDLMTLDAGKCYGPKGAGVLVHKRGVPIQPLLFGGDQEGGLRPGTENVSLIVGCVEALCRAQDGHHERAQQVSVLRDTLFDEIMTEIPEAVCNGSRHRRVANNCNISIPGIDGEFAVVSLDVQGIAASTRSACAGGKGGGSHVVATMTGDHERANNTIRFTLGEETTKEEIHRTVSALARHVHNSRIEE